MSQALCTLFQKLQENRIKYFLLTDFESDLDSNDIDLFVHPDYKKTFEETLLQSGWYKRKEPSHHTNHHFYLSSHSDKYLDVKYELTFAHGSSDCFVYKGTEQALANAVLNNRNMYRPKGIDAILLYAAHLGYRERGNLEARHKQNLKRYIDLYAQELAPGTGRILDEFNKWLTEGLPQNPSHLQQILQPYFTRYQKKMVRSKSYIRYGYGMKVLFLGTDGAGKSTLLEAVKKKLNLKTNKLYLGVGEDGWTWPWVKTFYHHRLSIRIADQVFSALKSYVVLPVELMLRQLPVKLKSKYSIVLIDRVPGANLIDKDPGKRIIYKSVIPKPDLVVFLYADPEVLRARKPLENTIERSKADLIKFRKVAEEVSSGNYISIDTSHMTVNEARDLIISEIYKNGKVYDNLLTTKF